MFEQGVLSRIMNDKTPLSIVYLGRRGGGARITKNISDDLKSSHTFSLVAICVRNDNELLREYDQSKIVTLFESLNSIATLIKIIHYVFAPKKLLSDLRLTEKGFCLVPMISPLGFLIEGLLKAQGVTVIRLLHDFEKHPGDNWPPSFLIQHIIKSSNFLIALSSDVARKIKSINPKIGISIYPHPIFNFSTSQIDVVTSNKYVLFIGRIRQYKGIENLIAAFNYLELKDIDLIIAGEGKLSVKVDERIKVINRWLQENEIASLIKNSEAVVFPYTEASQSGILPYCVSENKKVVVTPLPGLLEQTEGYRNTFVTKNFDIDSLSHALHAAIRSETFIAKHETPTTNIELCLLDSGFFTKK
jgi:glycosyltransferase involved in cell wall biosynthesis